MSVEEHVVGPEGIATFESPAGEDVVVLAGGAESGGQYDLLDFTIPPGPGVTPLHVHHDHDEAYYVLDGELTLRIGDERHVLAPGSYAIGPRGVPHTYRNSGDGPARVLITYVPGDHWQMLEEAAEYGPVQDESDIERMLPVLESHNVEMVGPPLGGEASDPS